MHAYTHEYIYMYVHLFKLLKVGSFHCYADSAQWVSSRMSILSEGGEERMWGRFSENEREREGGERVRVSIVMTLLAGTMRVN